MLTFNLWYNNNIVNFKSTAYRFQNDSLIYSLINLPAKYLELKIIHLSLHFFYEFLFQFNFLTKPEILSLLYVVWHNLAHYKYFIMDMTII